MGERDVFVRGGRWWGVIPRLEGEATRRSLRLRASAPREEAVSRWLEIVRGQRAADTAWNTPSVGDALDDYLAEQKRRGRSDATLEIDETKAGHFVRVWGRAMPLSFITASIVAKYVEQRESEKAHPRTIQRELVVLRGTLKLAIHLGRFGLPLERVMPLGFNPEYVPRKRWLTHDEARRLFDELPPERRGWFAFALSTGARKSEIEKVTFADIGENEVFIQGTKTARAEDTVPITSLQRPWLALAVKHADKSGPAFGVWTNVLRGLRKATQRLSTCASCRSKGRGTPARECLGCRRTPAFAPCTPNDLRRTLGYWLRDAGVEPHLIGKVLRHVDSRMAEMVYAKGSKDGLRSLIEKQLEVASTRVSGVKTVRQVVRRRARTGDQERRPGSRKAAKTA
jgi:integrase